MKTAAVLFALVVVAVVGEYLGTPGGGPSKYLDMALVRGATGTEYPRLEALVQGLPMFNFTVEARVRFLRRVAAEAIVSYAACPHTGAAMPPLPAGVDNNFLLYEYGNNSEVYVANVPFGVTLFGDPFDDAWRMRSVTVVKNADGRVNTTLYVDGVRMRSVVASAAAAQSVYGVAPEGRLVIGQEQDKCDTTGYDSSQSAEHHLDEVRWWSTVRTPAEMAGALTSSVIGNPDLVLHYTFDEIVDGKYPNLASSYGPLGASSGFHGVAALAPSPPGVPCTTAVIFVDAPYPPGVYGDTVVQYVRTVDVAGTLTAANFALDPAPSGTVDSVVLVSPNEYKVTITLTAAASCASSFDVVALAATITSASAPGTCTLAGDVRRAYVARTAEPTVRMYSLVATSDSQTYGVTAEASAGGTAPAVWSAFALEAHYSVAHTVTVNVTHSSGPTAFATFPPSRGNAEANVWSYTLPARTASTPPFHIYVNEPGTVSVTFTSSMAGSFTCLRSPTYTRTFSASSALRPQPVLLVSEVAHTFGGRYEPATYVSCADDGFSAANLFWLDQIVLAGAFPMRYTATPGQVAAWNGDAAMAAEVGLFFRAVLDGATLLGPETTSAAAARAMVAAALPVKLGGVAVGGSPFAYRVTVSPLPSHSVASEVVRVSVVTADGALAAPFLDRQMYHSEVKLNMASAALDVNGTADFSSLGVLSSSPLPPGMQVQLLFELRGAAPFLTAPFGVPTSAAPAPASGRTLVVGGSFSGKLMRLDVASDKWEAYSGGLATDVSAGNVLSLLRVPRGGGRVLAAGGAFGTNGLIEFDAVYGGHVAVAGAPVTAITRADFVGEYMFASDDGVIQTGSSLAAMGSGFGMGPAGANPDAFVTGAHLYDDGWRLHVSLFASLDRIVAVHKGVNQTVTVGGLAANVTAIGYAAFLPWQPRPGLLAGRGFGTVLLGRSVAPHLVVATPTVEVVGGAPGSGTLDGAVRAIECVEALGGCVIGGEFSGGVGLYSPGGGVAAFGGAISSGAVTAIVHDSEDGMVWIGGSFGPGSVSGCLTCAFVYGYDPVSSTIHELGAGVGSLAFPSDGQVLALAVVYDVAGPLQARVLNASSSGQSFAVGSMIELVYELPTIGQVGGSMQLKLEVESGSAIVAPGDWVSVTTTAQAEKSGLVSFAVRLTGLGQMSVRLYVADDAGMYVPSEEWRAVVVERTDADGPVPRAAVVMGVRLGVVPFASGRTALSDAVVVQVAADAGLYEFVAASYDIVYICTGAVASYIRTSIAAGFDGVVVFESIGSGNVGHKFKWLDVPVMIGEGHAYDGMGMGDPIGIVSVAPAAPSRVPFNLQIVPEGVPGGAYGVSSNLRVVSPVTAYARELYGDDVVGGSLIEFSTQSYLSLNIARVMPSADVAATDRMEPEHAVAFRYAAGAEMFDCFVAPAGRTGMPIASDWKPTFATTLTGMLYSSAHRVDVAEVASGVNGVFWGAPAPVPAATPGPPPPAVAPPPPDVVPPPPPLGAGSAATEEDLWILEPRNAGIAGGFVVVVVVAVVGVVVLKKVRGRSSVAAAPDAAPNEHPTPSMEKSAATSEVEMGEMRSVVGSGMAWEAESLIHHPSVPLGTGSVRSAPTIRGRRERPM